MHEDVPPTGRKRRKAGRVVVGLTAAALLTGMLSAFSAPNALADNGPTPSPTANPAPSTSTAPSTNARQSDPLTPPNSTTEPVLPAPTPAGCPICAPDNYSPADGTLFSHPFNSKRSSSSWAYRIRQHVLRTVNSVPAGGTIRIAVFSMIDSRTTDALIAARNRGVAVQVIANLHMIYNIKKNLPPSPSFKHLVKVLGNKKYRSNMNSRRVSFATVCSYSCRGHGGDMHYKMFLFSSAGSKKWITMVGSPNMTSRAYTGQWNHLNTYSNKATYDEYWRWMDQMRANTPRAKPFEKKQTDSVLSWTFPLKSASAGNDPMMQQLSKVSCAGGTKIRIGAYTFYNARGLWIAKRIRSLWNSGCDVAIEYAIMGDAVKRVLYSPAGRGRIPMRQVVTFTKKGVINVYDHAKWIAVHGRISGSANKYMTITGTTNISNLGFKGDDVQQVWRSGSVANAYFRDFTSIWNSKWAHIPSSTSSIGSAPGGADFRLGSGAYKNMEPN